MSLGTRLFVSNVPENANENDLRSAFSKFGEINNLDLKSKNLADDKKVFAFITLNASNYNVESCIKHFTTEEFKGNRLYVTRARESFLERLQRERQDAQRKETEKEQNHEPVNHNPIIKLSDKLNPRKRIFENQLAQPQTRQSVAYNDTEPQHEDANYDSVHKSNEKLNPRKRKVESQQAPQIIKSIIHNDTEKKRLDSMKQKRQEFKQKQMIIKAGLSAVDKLPNKKVKFSDNEEESVQVNGYQKEKVVFEKKKGPPPNKNSLFDDGDSDEDNEESVNFEIKKQFEGKKGQKVLDLQSRYKSDKRFTLDERFIEDDEQEDEETAHNNEEVELSQVDEKNKQLNILQNVLGVTIKRRDPDQDNHKPKLGMFRFDPLQPDHAKFLVQVENKTEPLKKSKKKKDKLDDKQNIETPFEKIDQEQNKIEVSKETFYKVSDTLKETIAQPKTFSLRSLFTKDVGQDDAPEQEKEYIPLEAPKKKKLNPLDPGERNPFVYDSSESENEEEKEDNEVSSVTTLTETKAVWKENLFFTTQDHRLLDGLEFFSKTPDAEGQKDRRELKSLMKRRIYNKERKNQMFQKKIGGRRKTMKKTYRKKS